MVSLGRKIWTITKIVLGALLVPISVVLLMGPVGEHVRMYERLESEGVTGAARVVAVWDTENTTTARANAVRRTLGTMTYTRHVQYEFGAANGEVVKGRIEFDAGSHFGPERGGTIEILYHPQAPRIHRAPRYSQPLRRLDPLTGFVAGTLSLLFAIYLVLRNGYRVYGWWSGPAGSRPAVRPAGVERVALADRGVAPLAGRPGRPLVAGGVASASAGFGTRGRR